MRVLKLHDLIHIHPLFFLLAISAILTGAILEFLILFTIVIIHELGHYFMAKRFGWRVTTIEIWLFGGAVVCEEHNSRPFYEQVRVVLAGPLQHVWIFFILVFLQLLFGPHPILSAAFKYNGLILLFNLLPIWPLDGGKLLFYLCAQLMPFHLSQKCSLFISMAMILFLAGYMTLGDLWTLSSIWLAAFLIVENGLEWRRKSYIYIRYLLYCCQNNRRGLKEKKIVLKDDAYVRDVLRNIRSNRQHLYVLQRLDGNYIVKEQECLHAFFYEKKADLTLRDVARWAG